MIHWREACEAALRAHTEADAVRFWGISHPGLEGPRPIFDYRFEHTLAVVKLARWLAPLAGADLEIVEGAAWLHDCRKFLNAGKTKDTHAQDASAAVAGILADTDFPPEKIPALRQAIELSNKRLQQDPKARDLITAARKEERFAPLRQSPEFQKLVPPQ
jgi:hypothetical protein